MDKENKRIREDEVKLPDLKDTQSPKQEGKSVTDNSNEEPNITSRVQKNNHKVKPEKKGKPDEPIEEKPLTEKQKKKQSRAAVTKRKKILSGISKFTWSIIGIIVVSGLILGYIMYDNYKRTSHWDKGVSMKMADQSLDLLYDDNPESRQSKLEFMELRDKMLNKNGTLTKDATSANVRDLKKLLDKIDLKSSEEDYQKLYAEVALKYSLQEKFDKLFTDEKHISLKKNVTPATLAKFNNETFDDLKKLYMINNKDEFVLNMIKEENKFSNDVEIFNQLVDTFNSVVIVKGDKVTLIEGYNGSLQSSFNKVKSGLEFNWESTEYMKTVVDLLQPTLEEIHKAYAEYKKYETDVANRDIALANWTAEQQQFLYEVQVIREQALAEKAAKEEAERIKKELDAGLPGAIQHLRQLTGLSSEEYNNYERRLNAAKSMDEVNQIIDEARKTSEDNIRKKSEEAAKEDELNNQNNGNNGTTESSTTRPPANNGGTTTSSSR